MCLPSSLFSCLFLLGFLFLFFLCGNSPTDPVAEVQVETGLCFWAYSEVQTFPEVKLLIQAHITLLLFPFGRQNNKANSLAGGGL